MKLRSETKILFIVLTACFAFSVVFAEIHTAADHDCIGEGCPVCLQIEAAEYFLKLLKLTVISLLLWAAYSVFLAQNRIKITGTIYRFSPVALKVRFNS
jgi:hypothetical protein